MLQVIRRLLTRPECFRLEREFAGPGSTGEYGAPWQGAPNNTSERKLRPCVIQRKVTNGYRAMWAAQAEADVRTTIDTARLAGKTPFDVIIANLA